MNRYDKGGSLLRFLYNWYYKIHCNMPVSDPSIDNNGEILSTIFSLQCLFLCLYNH